MRSLLGGKGANVAEMARIGVRVPDGFTVTTEACVETLRRNATWPEGLWREILEHLDALEERTGQRLGDPESPLLVSVRSGAVFSMPGMMDTILNLGIGDAAVEGLARSSGNERFAWDSYRRFLQMFGEVVVGVPGDLFEHALSRKKSERGGAERHRPDGRRPARARRGVSPAGARGDQRGLPGRPARAAAPRRRRRLPQLAEPARGRLPPRERHPGRPRHGRQRHADGVRQPRRDVGDRRLLHAQPLHRRQGAVRRVPARRPGRGRRRGHPHAPPARGARGRAAGRVRRAAADHGAARGPLRRHAGHRVHDRAGHAVPAADARGQAHRAGGDAGRARPRGRGRDHDRGGAAAHRPGAARPAAAPDDRPAGRARARRPRPQRLAGRRRGRRGARRGHSPSVAGAQARA